MEIKPRIAGSAMVSRVLEEKAPELLGEKSRLEAEIDGYDREKATLDAKAEKLRGQAEAAKKLKKRNTVMMWGTLIAGVGAAAGLACVSLALLPLCAVGLTFAEASLYKKREVYERAIFFGGDGPMSGSISREIVALQKQMAVEQLAKTNEKIAAKARELEAVEKMAAPLAGGDGRSAAEVTSAERFVVIDGVRLAKAKVAGVHDDQQPPHRG